MTALLLPGQSSTAGIKANSHESKGIFYRPQNWINAVLLYLSIVLPGEVKGEFFFSLSKNYVDLVFLFAK